MSDQGESFEWVVERGKISEFARAVLNESEACQKDNAVAPPTFPRTVGFWRPRGGAGRPQPGRRGMDMRRVLHGEEEYEYLRPLRAGDVLTVSTEIKDSYQKEGKRGGTMRFVITETTYRDQKGEVVARSRSTTIQTGKAVES